MSTNNRKPTETPPPRPMGPRGGRGSGPGGLGAGVGDKAKNFAKSSRRLLGYMANHKITLIFVILTAIAATVFSIVAPKVMGQATTKIYEGIMGQGGLDYAGIANILVTLTILYIFGSVFTFIQGFVMAGVSQRIIYDMREQINAKMSKLPMKFYDGMPHGELLSRVTNDIDSISNTLQQSITQVITAVVTIVGVIVMMLSINAWLTLITAITLPLSFVIVRKIVKKSQGYFIAQQKELGQMNGHVEEVFSGHNIVKAYGLEDKVTNEFDAINAKLYESAWKSQFISGIMMPLMQLVGNIGYVGVCVVGGIFVTNGQITIGDMQAFIQYVRNFTRPIADTANIANILQSTIASAERVFEILDQEEELPDKADAVEIDVPKGDVDFAGVGFSYDPKTPLINNMNIQAHAGDTIAIVGPTGAGKTTIVNLLMRFYEIQGGSISIDGIDIRDLKRTNLRKMFGMVLQDTWLFNGTIKENIAYGINNATDEDIINAAKTAHADHFIRTLPHGYDTVINEEANNLSLGQNQLLTIARAILANPDVLILDEATSNVDTRTELLIQKAMNELMKGRTSFVIAHRLSTIKDADVILVMNHGTLIEQGTHEQLLEQNGFYADLYNSQFTGKKSKIA